MYRWAVNLIGALCERVLEKQEAKAAGDCEIFIPSLKRKLSAESPHCYSIGAGRPGAAGHRSEEHGCH